MAKTTLITTSGAVVYKEGRGKNFFLIVKQKPEGDWEIPKITVRRGESSVRASIRMTGELGGMNARVYEEVGRGAGSTLVNGKSTPTRYYYYILKLLSAGEVLGFEDHTWLPFDKAKAKLTNKRDIAALVSARDLLKTWEKERKKKK